MAVNALAVAGRLGAASDALAALGALIRIETEGLDADPEVHAALRAIAAELLGDPAVDPVRDAPVLGLAQTFLAQGAELLANPGRSRGLESGRRAAAAGHRPDVDGHRRGHPDRRGAGARAG